MKNKSGLASARRNKKKFLNKVLYLILIIVAVYVASYFYCRNTQAFFLAEEFITESHEIRRELGDIKKISLSPFGYEFSVAGDSGSATFVCNVEGGLAQGKISVDVEKNLGMWGIKSSKLRIDDRLIDINVAPQAGVRNHN